MSSGESELPLPKVPHNSLSVSLMSLKLSSESETMASRLAGVESLRHQLERRGESSTCEPLVESIVTPEMTEMPARDRTQGHASWSQTRLTTTWGPQSMLLQTFLIIPNGSDVFDALLLFL